MGGISRSGCCDHFLGDCLWNGSPCAIRPLPCVCLSVLSVTFVYCGQTAGWIKMPLGTKVDLGPGNFVLGGDPAPPQKRGACPQFLVHVYCGQTAGWIKMPLGTKIGLSPAKIVLDGDPAPKGAHLPQFSAHVCCCQMAESIKTSLGMEVGLGPGDIVLDGDPAPS